VVEYLKCSSPQTSAPANADSEEERLKVTQLYDSVTQSIIKELEAGAVPWTRPWRTPRGAVGSIMPHNFSTGRACSGINIPILWGAAAQHGYNRHLWLTLRQALYPGGVVRKGEKSTHVVFTKKLLIKDSESEEQKKVGMLRDYNVFNIAQVDNLQEPPAPKPVPEHDRHQLAECFIDRIGADIRHGEDKACYVSSLDFVATPLIGSFKQVSSYYATKLHELGHWSGAKHRLDRDLSGRFGTQAYAAEELIAELTAAFLCGHLGVEGELRHAGFCRKS
jgi:antirestriction protein ArdC